MAIIRTLVESLKRVITDSLAQRMTLQMLNEDGDEPIPWRVLLEINRKDIAPLVDARFSSLDARTLSDQPLDPLPSPLPLTPEDVEEIRRLIESVGDLNEQS